MRPLLGGRVPEIAGAVGGRTHVELIVDVAHAPHPEHPGDQAVELGPEENRVGRRLLTTLVRRSARRSDRVGPTWR